MENASDAYNGTKVKRYGERGIQEEDMGFDDLTSEQKAKAQACKTPEEILALAKEEGYELSSEELDSIVGGAGWLDFLNSKNCPDNVMKPLHYLG